MVLVKRGKVFHLFILRKIEQENVIGDILDRKRVFLDYKNIKTFFFLRPKFTITDEKNRRKKIARTGRKKGGKGKINGCTQFYIDCFGDFGQKSFTAEELCLAVTYLKSSYINFRKFWWMLGILYTIRQLLKRMFPPGLILPVNDMFTIFN